MLVEVKMNWLMSNRKKRYSKMRMRYLGDSESAVTVHVFLTKAEKEAAAREAGSLPPLYPKLHT